MSRIHPKWFWYSRCIIQNFFGWKWQKCNSNQPQLTLWGGLLLVIHYYITNHPITQNLAAYDCYFVQFLWIRILGVTYLVVLPQGLSWSWNQGVSWLQSLKGLFGVEGHTSQVAHLHGYWQVTWLFCHMDFCTGLLEYSPNMLAGFPWMEQSKPARQKQVDTIYGWN